MIQELRNSESAFYEYKRLFSIVVTAIVVVPNGDDIGNTSFLYIITYVS